MNNFGLYLREIGEYPLLTPDQELELAYQMRDTNPAIASAAREQLINSNLRLVVSIAKTFKNGRLSIDDLVMYGNFGLITAVGKFNPDLGYRFSTCATPWIKQSITKGIMDNGRVVRLPAHIFQLLGKYRKLISEWENENREFTPEDIARELGIDLEKLRLLESHRYDAACLDKTVDEDEETTMGELIADNGPTPADKLIEWDERRIILDAIHTLKPRTQKIIKMRFGLAEDGDPVEFSTNHTLEEVGNYIGLSRERIRQIEKEALTELRRILTPIMN